MSFKKRDLLVKSFSDIEIRKIKKIIDKELEIYLMLKLERDYELGFIKV